MNDKRVALVHDFLIQNGGAEKTLEALVEIFPDATIFTSVYEPANFGPEINKCKVVTPNTLNKVFKTIPLLSKYFTFLTPLAFENFDLSEFDLVISDSSAYAKGVITSPRQVHISYIHTPPRFLYKYSVENTKRTAWYYKPVVTIVDHFLRIWDFAAAQRADYIVANSKEIQKRISKYYRRESVVIYPPVELATDTLPETATDSSLSEIIKTKYYLLAGRMVAYKNFDKVIQVFNELTDYKLVIVGTGPEENKLKAIAGTNVTFVGRVNDTDKHILMKHSLGLINPVQDEDLGIVPIEVISHGVPVLAHRSAGHLETVVENVSGMFFESLEKNHLKDKIAEFDHKIKSNFFDKTKMKQTVERFSKKAFQNEILGFIAKVQNKDARTS